MRLISQPRLNVKMVIALLIILLWQKSRKPKSPRPFGQRRHLGRNHLQVLALNCSRWVQKIHFWNQTEKKTDQDLQWRPVHQADHGLRAISWRACWKKSVRDNLRMRNRPGWIFKDEIDVWSYIRPNFVDTVVKKFTKKDELLEEKINSKASDTEDSKRIDIIHKEQSVRATAKQAAKRKIKVSNRIWCYHRTKFCG